MQPAKGYNPNEQIHIQRAAKMPPTKKRKKACKTKGKKK